MQVKERKRSEDNIERDTFLLPACHQASKHTSPCASVSMDACRPSRELLTRCCCDGGDDLRCTHLCIYASGDSCSPALIEKRVRRCVLLEAAASISASLSSSSVSQAPLTTSSLSRLAHQELDVRSHTQQQFIRNPDDLSPSRVQERDEPPEG